MKLKYDFAVREIMGEYVLIPVGEGALGFSGMISTSETGAALVNVLKQDVSRQEMMDHLLREYEVDEKTAAEDLDGFLLQLNKLNLLIEE